MARYVLLLVGIGFVLPMAAALPGAEYQVVENGDRISIATPQLQAAIRKKEYVTGVAAGSLVDRQTGFHDAGFGLDIVDWLMEPGSDLSYRDKLDPELVYQYNNPWHGARPKRSIEGPQICVRAGKLDPQVVRGKDFVAVHQQYRYHLAAPGRKAGSVWTQWLVFPAGVRWFLSMDRIDSVNESPAGFLRLDMPGHIRHHQGDTFSEVYLSYRGTIPSSEFFADFPPDARFDYRRDRDRVPERMIRAYHLRDPQSGKAGPWLAGMTLAPSVVSEAWCHQRGYVCMIEEIGGRPIRPGQSFQAAFVVGFFDSIEEMQKVYDRYRDHTGLEVTAEGWKLVKAKAPAQDLQAGQSSAIEKVVRITFPNRGYAFTVGQASKGISIDYKIIVDKDVPDVIPKAQDIGSGDPLDPSGLIVFEKLTGNEQSYGLFDRGLGQPRSTPVVVRKGVYSHTFQWDGRNWSGPSDTNVRKGPPFPPGIYTLSISATGEQKVGNARRPFRIEASVPVTLNK